METAAPRVVVVIVDGLPRALLERLLPALDFLRDRCPHRSEAVSCFPSTTGPAYFPFLAGSTPGRANVPGIRWFDRTRKTRTRFPHRGLRSYVGPDAAKMKGDTALTTMFARHAWPASSPVGKDIPKHGEKSRDLLWTAAHFFHTWDVADRRTAWKLGRGLKKGRPILFAVFPSVDEFGHFHGASHERAAEALREIDAMLAEKLGDYDGELVVSADHGLTDTETHLDLRALVEERAGPTVAFPLVAKPNPEAVVCESGNAMANVYLRGADGWPSLPDSERCRTLARELLELEGIDSVATRGEHEHTAELLTHEPSNTVLQGLEPGSAQGSDPSNRVLLGEVGLGWRRPLAARARVRNRVRRPRPRRCSRALARGTEPRRRVRTGVPLRLRASRRPARVRLPRLRPAHEARVARAPCVARRSARRPHRRARPLLRPAPRPAAAHARSLRPRSRARGRAAGGVPAVRCPPACPRRLGARGRTLRRLLAAANARFKWIALVGTILGVAVALWSQRTAVADFNWRVSWTALTLSILLFAVAPIAQGVSFWLILRFLGLESRLDEALLIWMRSFLLRYAPSGALAVVIRVRERERLGATKAHVLTATVYEQLVALVSGAVASALAFAIAPDAIPKLVAVAAAIALVVAVALRPRFLGLPLQALLMRRGVEVPAILRGRTLTAVIALNTASWAATGAAVWVLVVALSEGGTPRPNAFWLLGAYSFAWLLGFVVPLLPGGLGLREGTLAAFLAARFGAGVAAALALALRLVNTAGEFLAIAAVELGYRVYARLRPRVPELWAELRRPGPARL